MHGNTKRNVLRLMENNTNRQNIRIEMAGKMLFLESNGWKVLRISWRDMFNRAQPMIKIAKSFIDVDVSVG